jgi:hypothetical protein
MALAGLASADVVYGSRKLGLLRRGAAVETATVLILRNEMRTPRGNWRLVVAKAMPRESQTEPFCSPPAMARGGLDLISFGVALVALG